MTETWRTNEEDLVAEGDLGVEEGRRGDLGDEVRWLRGEGRLEGEEGGTKTETRLAEIFQHLRVGRLQLGGRGRREREEEGDGRWQGRVEGEGQR